MTEWTAHQYTRHGLRTLQLSAPTLIASVLMLATGNWGFAVGAGAASVLTLAAGVYWVHQSAVLAEEANRDD